MKGLRRELVEKKVKIRASERISKLCVRECIKERKKRIMQVNTMLAYTCLYPCERTCLLLCGKGARILAECA